MVDNTSISYEVENDSEVNIKLYDVKGRVIANSILNTKVSSGNHTSKIDVSEIASGVFFAKVTLENKTGKSVKIIKLIKKIT